MAEQRDRTQREANDYDAGLERRFDATHDAILQQQPAVRYATPVQVRQRLRHVGRNREQTVTPREPQPRRLLLRGGRWGQRRRGAGAHVHREDVRLRQNRRLSDLPSRRLRSPSLWTEQLGRSC